MAKRTAKKKPALPTANDNEATMVVTLYDGTRQPIQGGDFLIRILDGFQNMLFADYKTAPTTVFRLPYRDNLQDNCTVLATGNGHVDAGFTPVKLSTAAIAMVDLMLLPDKATFDFLQWGALKDADSTVASFISLGSSDAQAQGHYDDLRKNKPAALASLLNWLKIASLVMQINLWWTKYAGQHWTVSLLQNPTRACFILTPRRASSKFNLVKQMSSSRSMRRMCRTSTELPASKWSRTLTTTRTWALTPCWK